MMEQELLLLILTPEAGFAFLAMTELLPWIVSEAGLEQTSLDQEATLEPTLTTTTRLAAMLFIQHLQAQATILKTLAIKLLEVREL
jgi:hypothetical protein